MTAAQCVEAFLFGMAVGGLLFIAVTGVAVANGWRWR